MSPADPRAPAFVILGAGLAGLSLADALLRRGVREPIVIVDQREAFENDRTWCFWDVVPHPYQHLVSHRWHQWAFAAGGASYRHASSASPYCYLPADRFYEDVLTRVRAAPNCTLMLGTTIGRVQDQGDSVLVETSSGELVASYVFDAMATGGPSWPSAAPRPGPGVLCQRFLGWFVEADRPVFDSECVMLMDFDVTPNGELHFMYVVPFSPTSALVEDTTIGPQGVASAERRDEVRRYLEERYGLTDWRVVREEESVIPMLGVRQARRAAARVIPVGTAAGAVRPSSGYTFIRTQRQVAAIADRVGRGQPAAVAVGRFRDAFLDRVFLEVLEADPAGFYPNLVMLGRRLSGDRFARFMMDAAGPVDMFCMIAALPKLPFLAGAARVGREAVRR